MKSLIPTLAFGAFLAAAGSAHATFVLVPNGDFSTANGDQWDLAPEDPGVVTFQETGGNPDGFGKIDASAGGGWGVLVAEGGTGPAPTPENPGIPLGDLGLTAGESYVFHWDQIDLAVGLPGEGKVAGIKIESWGAGVAISDSGNITFPTNPTWTAESFAYTIAPDADAIKVVMVALEGDGIAGFDNVGVDNTPVVLPPGPLVPNGDFENAGSQWVFFQAGDHTVSYPATGGNPGTFARIDASAPGGYAGIASSELSLSDLGLTVGETYDFTVDMKIISGSNIGKFKVEYYPVGGATDELIPDLIGDGSTWETYTFPVPIITGTERIKIVPLWGADSVIGYDNVDIIVPEPEYFSANITTGTVVTWSPTSAVNLYQPQESSDNSNWTDLGPELTGNSVSSLCDADGSPFYRVLETELNATELLEDGSFEESGFWETGGSNPPQEVNSNDPGEDGNSVTGEWSYRLAADNGLVDAPKTSELRQIGLAGGVTGGATHNFSMWAKVETNEGANLTYAIQWRDIGGAVLVGDTVSGNMNSLPIGVWTNITRSDLIAPPTAVSVNIEIVCVTGAVVGHAGSMLVDDISLLALGSSAAPVAIPATGVPGVEISWESKLGKVYQVNSASSLMSWSPLGDPIAGTGEILSVCDPLDTTDYYQVVESNP